MKEEIGTAQVLELRIDGIRRVNIKKLLAHKRGEILITNRSQGEGGFFLGGEQDRVALLIQAVASGADYVDVEMRTEAPLIDKLKEKIKTLQADTRLILSYHNFEKTPGHKELRKKLDEGRKAGADIVKIVPYARVMADNLKVLSLIPYAQKKGLKVIAFCMGEKGKLSRIMAPLLGSYLTYASWAKGMESAPGQMTGKELR
ncbi:MAG: type I 3-dehydroquinate dehydratase, partial [Syntrophales bacterium LBB04]|nr:type I 3-dehydroquinate dehydratase [Syntrophales bacterium LBB04]